MVILSSYAPGNHHVGSPFGTQVIGDLAGGLLLAWLRPPKLFPDTGRRILNRLAEGCCVRDDDLSRFRVLNRRDILAYHLRLDGVSRHDFLVAVIDEDISVF